MEGLTAVVETDDTPRSAAYVARHWIPWVSRRSVARWSTKGITIKGVHLKLTGIRYGRQMRFRHADVTSFLDAMQRAENRDPNTVPDDIQARLAALGGA